MKDKIERIISGILMWVGMWCFTRMYDYVDLYIPGHGKDEDAPVKGVTFSADEDYIDYVGEYEVKSK